MDMRGKTLDELMQENKNTLSKLKKEDAKPSIVRSINPNKIPANKSHVIVNEDGIKPWTPEKKLKTQKNSLKDLKSQLNQISTTRKLNKSKQNK